MLWLATAIVHHANRVRENRSGVKVGGHQASSASMVSLMTALWFSELRAEDRVSVKPHASPVLHAINYLLGRLERPALETLRAFGGLQSYPSRTKDPDPVDYSTGSVGHRRDGPDLERVRAPLPGHASLRGTADGPPAGAGGGRRAGRGRNLGGDRRPQRGQARRGGLGRGPQPPVARSRGAGHRLRPLGADVRGGRLADDQREVRHAAWTSCSSARAAPSCASASTRCRTRSISACCDREPEELRERLPGARPQARQARRRAGRRRAARRGARPRRPRPGQADRGLPRRSTTTAPRSCSRTRSRAGRSRSRATPRTTRRC